MKYYYQTFSDRWKEHYLLENEMGEYDLYINENETGNASKDHWFWSKQPPNQGVPPTAKVISKKEYEEMMFLNNI